jgi:hypothetical protein
MAKNLVSRVWRLGGVFFLICFAVHFSLGPASARKIAPSERAMLERALKDVQDTRELQTLEDMSRRIRTRKASGKRRG